MNKFGSTIFLLLAVLLACPLHAQRHNLDSLYQVLDREIEQAGKYTAQREQTIDGLRRKLAGTTALPQRYSLAYQLYEQFSAFKSDSAIHYLDVCTKLARQMGNEADAGRCMALRSFLSSTVGMYTEALDILARIDTTKLDRDGMGKYYLAQNHAWDELSYYTTQPDMRERYTQLGAAHMANIERYLDPDDDNLLMRQEMRYLLAKDFKKALEVSDKRLAVVKMFSREFAIVAFYRYLDYNTLGQKHEGRYWLVLSALSDVRNAVNDQGSVWELAAGLNAEGDLDRSYRYIRYAWTCAQAFGTRVRSQQISPVLTVIDASYQEEAARNNRLLLCLVVVLALLAVLLLAIMAYAHRQHQRVKRMSEQLAADGKRLQQLNQQLTSSNEQLQAANSSLSEASQVKEEYIGRFLTMCSQYIDRMSRYRKHVNKRLKSREYDVLYNENRESLSEEEEFGQLYENFDSAFLHLYPNFVADFNALLREEERSVPQQEGRLTTSLRIFALIRLGVDDSSKIAEFLHYSVNTIYNYRARVKRGAIGDRDDFENQVKQISR